MTDKEKRELKDGVISVFKRFNILDRTATIGGLRDDILRYINSLQEEPVSKDLEGAVKKYLTSLRMSHFEGYDIERAFKKGAQWQKEHLWKPADGDDLPEIDREVIALIEAFGHYKVIFAHRVDENAEIHTSIDGKPLVLHPKKHGKGGWNISNIKWWLDIELPKIEE